MKRKKRSVQTTLSFGSLPETNEEVIDVESFIADQQCLKMRGFFPSNSRKADIFMSACEKQERNVEMAKSELKKEMELHKEESAIINEGRVLNPSLLARTCSESHTVVVLSGCDPLSVRQLCCAHDDDPLLSSDKSKHFSKHFSLSRDEAVSVLEKIIRNSIEIHQKERKDGPLIEKEKNGCQCATRRKWSNIMSRLSAKFGVELAFDNRLSTNNCKSCCLWSDLFGPSNVDDCFGSERSISKLLTLLEKCCDDESDASDDPTFVARNSFGNLIVVLGETGSGKSASVHLCAQKHDYRVLEVHSGMKRERKSVMSLVGEATRSRGVQQYSQQKEREPPVRNKKRRKRVIVDNNKDTACGLVLFDDADVVFEEDKGFTEVVAKLVSQTRCPIIATCNVDHAYHSMQPVVVHFERPDSLKIMARLLSFLWELSPKERCCMSSLWNVIQYFDNDVRRIMLHLQMYYCRQFSLLPSLGISVSDIRKQLRGQYCVSNSWNSDLDVALHTYARLILECTENSQEAFDICHEVSNDDDTRDVSNDLDFHLLDDVSDQVDEPKKSVVYCCNIKGLNFLSSARELLDNLSRGDLYNHDAADFVEMRSLSRFLQYNDVSNAFGKNDCPLSDTLSPERNIGSSLLEGNVFFSNPHFFSEMERRSRFYSSFASDWPCACRFSRTSFLSDVIPSLRNLCAIQEAQREGKRRFMHYLRRTFLNADYEHLVNYLM